MTDNGIAAAINDRDAAELARYLDNSFESDILGDTWFAAGSGVLDVIYTDEDWGKEGIRTMFWIAKDAGYAVSFDGEPADCDWDGLRSALSREVQKRVEALGSAIPTAAPDTDAGVTVV